MQRVRRILNASSSPDVEFEDYGWRKREARVADTLRQARRYLLSDTTTQFWAGADDWRSVAASGCMVVIRAALFRLPSKRVKQVQIFNTAPMLLLRT